MYKKIKCTHCGRTLCDLIGHIIIVCRRCGKVNTLSTETTEKRD